MAKHRTFRFKKKHTHKGKQTSLEKPTQQKYEQFNENQIYIYFRKVGDYCIL